MRLKLATAGFQPAVDHGEYTQSGGWGSAADPRMNLVYCEGIYPLIFIGYDDRRERATAMAMDRGADATQAHHERLR